MLWQNDQPSGARRFIFILGFRLTITIYSKDQDCETNVMVTLMPQTIKKSITLSSENIWLTLHEKRKNLTRWKVPGYKDESAMLTPSFVKLAYLANSRCCYGISQSVQFVRMQDFLHMRVYSCGNVVLVLLIVRGRGKITESVRWTS